MKNFIKGFKEFAMRGNVVDLAVGVMIGGAFGKIVTSLVNDLIMPLLGLILGRINLKGAFLTLNGVRYASVEEATAAGAGVFNYGAFITTVIDFILMALVIYVIVTLIQRVKPKTPLAPPKPQPNLCPHCKTEVHPDATRCPHCTSYLIEDDPSDPGFLPVGAEVGEN
ncbi:MAG: large conductance mechanosensitive channel protein MscL [Oscillospiraceae bacterium]|jgi:large conductance mechanosensitive channel|nr:large conductance mechanosensitive channel protein MscL [Oscillospiraceae bacterium]